MTTICVFPSLESSTVKACLLPSAASAQIVDLTNGGVSAVVNLELRVTGTGRAEINFVGAISAGGHVLTSTGSGKDSITATAPFTGANLYFLTETGSGGSGGQGCGRDRSVD
jgi:hypothetical protein